MAEKREYKALVLPRLAPMYDFLVCPYVVIGGNITFADMALVQTSLYEKRVNKTSTRVYLRTSE